jgi:hypothetical protein
MCRNFAWRVELDVTVMWRARWASTASRAAWQSARRALTVPGFGREKERIASKMWGYAAMSRAARGSGVGASSGAVAAADVTSEAAGAAGDAVGGAGATAVAAMMLDVMSRERRCAGR